MSDKEVVTKEVIGWFVFMSEARNLICIYIVAQNGNIDITRIPRQVNFPNISRQKADYFGGTLLICLIFRDPFHKIGN